MERLERFSEFLPESQGHNRALTVLHVPYSLDSGSQTASRAWPQAIPQASVFQIDCECAPGNAARATVLSHTKRFQSRFAEVDSPKNPSTYPFLFLIKRKERRICVGIGFSKMTMKTLCV
jgi:hypothetical protein